MKILNIFVSQPMSGIALEEIEKKRNFIVSRVALAVEKKTGLTWKVARGCKCEYYVAKEYKKDCYSVTSPILGEVSKYLQDK